MAITNGYCTGEQLNGWLSGQVPSDQQSELESSINAASRWIDRYTGRHFFQVTATARTFAPTAPYFLELGCDLVSATTLKTGTDGVTYGTTVSTSDYQLLSDPDDYNPSQVGEARPYRYVEMIGDAFPSRSTRRRNVVEITGTWGWAAVPAAVTQACLMQAAALFNRKNSVGGIQGMNDFGVVRVGNQLDRDVRDLLGPYRVDFGVA